MIIKLKISGHKKNFFVSLLSRKYSSLDDSITQELFNDIDYINNDLKSIMLEKVNFPYMTPPELLILKMSIRLGLYKFQPIQIRRVKQSNYEKYLFMLLLECSDMMLESDSETQMINFVMPHKDDVLVFKGLAKMLLRLTIVDPEFGYIVPRLGYMIEDLNNYKKFLSLANQKGQYNKLYRVELSQYFYQITRYQVIDLIKPIVGDGAVFKLIESYLHLPLQDENGNSVDRTSEIPRSGDIARVLFNFVLKDVFDSEFAKRFPGVEFIRTVDEVFIFTSERDLFDYTGYNKMDKDLLLNSYIEQTYPGGRLFKNKLGWRIYLDKEGFLIVDKRLMVQDEDLRDSYLSEDQDL